MIDQADGRLRDWVGSVLAATTVTLAPPGDEQGGRGVSLYLLELIATPPPRSTRRPPLQLSLRYLVTTWADDPLEAHRLLGELVFAAMEVPDFEVELEPLPSHAWTALRAVPRPSFVLRVPLRVERPEPAARLVRHPLVLKAVPSASLHGLILGPGDVPIAGARVELPALQLSAYTDGQGHFRFAAVPSEPRAQLLRVRARGRELSVTAEPPAAEGEPVVIHFEL